MSQGYNKSEIPIINPTYNGVVKDKRQVVSVVDGEMKLLKCSSEILESVLSLIDGVRTFQEIEEELLKSYTETGIKSFLTTLLKDNIIYPIIENKQRKKCSKISIIGIGHLSAILREVIERSYKNF